MALIEAAECDNREELTDKRIWIHKMKIALIEAAECDNHEKLTVILSSVKDAGSSPLHLLLTPDTDRWLAVHYAALYDHYDGMESMLKSLNKSEDRLQLLMSRVDLGITVYIVAVLQESVQTVKIIQEYLSTDHLFELTKAQTDISLWTVLHWSARQNETDMMQVVMDPLTDEQILDLVVIRDKDGYTPKDRAVRRNNKQAVELLDKTTTAAMISRLTKQTTDRQAKDRWLAKLTHQPLTSQQLMELYPHSTSYLIPQNQEAVKQRALIFYSKRDRDGAEEEADNLSESLITAGCDVIKHVWDQVSELQLLIADHLHQTSGSASVLILCLMSHGSMGYLQGGDREISINTILKQVCDNIPHHVPLVMVIQACQGSRFGIRLQEDTGTADPRVCNDVTPEDMNIVLTRPHTVLLQATVTGGAAYRGRYTGALADQFRKANGKISIYDMHEEAATEIEGIQSPMITSSLKKRLVLPGP